MNDADENEQTHLLHDSAAVHLERELENVTLENLGHRRLLRLASLLEELLNHVCAKPRKPSVVSTKNE